MRISGFGKQREKDVVAAQKFNNLFCFINDLRATNNDGKFENPFHEIQFQELELKKEKTSLFQASFLGLNVKSLKKNYVRSL